MKIAITSDNHLGYRQYMLDIRESDFEDAFMAMLYKVKDLGITHVLSAGDLLNVKRPSPRTIQFLQNAGRWMRDNGITFYSIMGNHDKTSPSWIDILSDYNFVHLDGNTATLKSGDESVTVLGFREMSKLEYTEVFNDCREADILLIHAPILEFIEYYGEKAGDTLSVQDLPGEKFSLIVVGDTHIPMYIPHSPSGTPVLSPGPSESNSRAEQDEKFLWIADLLENRSFKLDKVTIPTRKTLRYEVTEESEITEVIDDIQKEIAMGNDSPIIHYSYDREVPGCLSRVMGILDLDKVIFRHYVLPRAEREIIKAKKEGIEVSEEEIREVKIPTIGEVVRSNLNQDLPYAGLVYDICTARDGGVGELIQNYFDKRVEELQQQG